MQLPANWNLYSQSIDERCQDLIDYNIWQGITLEQYKIWRKNFKTDEEKYLAACILDSLIYRSDEQTAAMIEDNLFKNIINTFRLHGPPRNANLNFPYCLQQSKEEPYIRIVLTLKANDQLGKGAQIIGREIKRRFKINPKYIIDPISIKGEYNEKGIKTFIFIDDFSGTGDTFCEVYDQSKVAELNEVYTVFSPLAIHNAAITKISRNKPKVKLCYAERLEESNSFFKFGDSEEASNELVETYKRFVKRKLKSVRNKNIMGYGGLGLLYSFEHACPNNSLPILYHENDGWQPLFRR